MSVLRVCSASPSWKTARKSTTTSTDTIAKSATAAPRSSAGRRIGLGSALHRGHRALEHVDELVLGDDPQGGDEAGRHQGDEHPAGHVAALGPAPAPLEQAAGRRLLRRARRGCG